MRYPVTLTPDDNGTIMATFPDVPGAVTYGETTEEALAHAPDALLTILDAYMRDRRDIPEPSRSSGPSVAIPPLETAKLALYHAMRQQKVGKAELGRRLHWHLPQVDRLLDVRHASRVDQLEAGLSALGKRLVVSVEDVSTAGDIPTRLVARRAGSARSRAPRRTPRPPHRARAPRPGRRNTKRS